MLNFIIQVDKENGMPINDFTYQAYDAISFADDGVSDQQCFFVLKTEGWSVNDASEIEKITNALNEGIKVIKEKLNE